MAKKTSGKGHARRCRRPVDQLVARIKLQLATQYIADLRTWQDGDENRFGRMVNGRGVAQGSPSEWVRMITAILGRDDVWVYQPGVARRLCRKMRAMGYQVAEK